MTEDMVERVARALLDALGQSVDAQRLELQNGVITFDGSIEQDKLARAAIEAMREPTPEMMDAADAQTYEPASKLVKAIYRAMIDAALTGPKT